MLEVKSLNIGYDAPLLTEAIDGVWRKGDVVVLLGDNGVGKSTFLRTLAGLQSAVSGEVFLKNDKIAKVLYFLIVSDFFNIN